MSERYIMKRTEILCPNCLRKKLIHEKGKDIYCDDCGTQYEYVDEKNKTFKYK